MEEANGKLASESGMDPSRRFAFDVTSRRQYSSMDHLDKRRHHPCCFACCCAGSCLIMFCIIISVVFIGITYLAFLKSGMPKANVRAFNITKLQVDEGSQKMNAVISLGLILSNKNDKLKLLYGPLNVDVTSENVVLGRKKVDTFFQKPLNDTNLNINMTLDHANVNKYAVAELKSDIKAYEMVFNVYASGRIGFKVGKLQMHTVPFLVSCNQIKRKDVDFGKRPQCDVKLFAIRPSSN